MNFATLLDRHPESSTALISQGRVTTYGQLRRQVEDLRGGLVRCGLEPGDRLAIVTANTWFFVVSYLATLGVGGVAVPLNPQAPPVELERELAATGARIAVVGPRGRDSFAGVDRMAVELERVLVPEGVRLDAAEPFDELFGGEPAPVVARDEHDDAVLMFTAGTAGPRKAARLTHGNLLSNLQQVQAHPGLVGGPEDVALGVLPLFHIFGLNAVLGLALYVGSSIVLLERFDPSSSLEAVREHGITVVAGAPPLFGAWAAVPGVDASALASVRLVVSGGAPLADEVEEAFRARFDKPIWQGYGLTETAPIVTTSLVGVSDPYTGEAVKAYVVPEQGRHLEEDEVIEFCAERLARYKCPSSVSFVDQIPQGLVGKVLRRALRESPGDGPE
jgi:long-chain acyl-CoA synthetase